MKILKVGDTIEWDFPVNHKSVFSGKTFKAKISMVDKVDKCYGAYAEYGQDLIPFGQCKKVDK